MNDIAPFIAVIGPSSASPSEKEWAFEVGARLAECKAIVLTGSLAGVSAAAAAGARRASGKVIQLLPGLDRPEVGGDIAIPTGLGELCNGLLVRAADAVISVGGGWGTLVEIALAMRTGVPVVSLGGWRVVDAESRPLHGQGGPESVRDAVSMVMTAAADRLKSSAPRCG